MADIVVKEYHPQLLIYGTSIRDFHPEAGAGVMSAVVEIPWTEYYFGNLSLSGWLAHNSDAYRYYLAIKSGSDEEYARQLERYENAVTYDGFRPKGDVPNSHSPRTPENSPEYYAGWAAQMAGFRISEDNFEGLRNLVALRQQGVQVVLVEMPLPSVYWAILEDGQDTYEEDFVEKIEAYASSENIPYVRTIPQADIPDDLFADYEHMNQLGAEMFSNWLGHAFGAMVQQGSISFPVSSG